MCNIYLFFLYFILHLVFQCFAVNFNWGSDSVLLSLRFQPLLSTVCFERREGVNIEKKMMLSS